MTDHGAKWTANQQYIHPHVKKARTGNGRNETKPETMPYNEGAISY